MKIHDFAAPPIPTYSFRRLDGLRALRIARDGGIEPAMIEIVAKDGTTFRVYGDKAVTIPANAEPGVTKEWQEAIDELKKPKPK
jgi:hypothetical protein